MFFIEKMKFKLTARSIHELGQRSNQEDSLYPQLTKDAQDGSLYILCDGMGGHAAGEVASQTVCETMSRYIETHTREDGFFDEKDFYAALNAAYDALDAKDTEDEKKMGTTLTFVKFHSGGCFIAHIGDSRIYHIRPSEHRILHVTRDHSLVNDLIRLGELTPEEAKTSRQKNVITRAVQPHQETRTKADCLNITDLKEGDYFYMCSDGMLEQAEDEEIVNILSLQRPDEEKIKILIGTTKNNKDNHSAHLIRIKKVLEEEGVLMLDQERIQEPSLQDEPISSEEESPVAIVPPGSNSSRSGKSKSFIPVIAFLVAIGIVSFMFGRKDMIKEHLAGRNDAKDTAAANVAVNKDALESSPALGKIVVKCTPSDAIIWLDGKNTKLKTPTTLENISPGEHRVKVVKEGYEPYEESVTVSPITIAYVTNPLNPVPAKKPSAPTKDKTQPADAEPQPFITNDSNKEQSVPPQETSTKEGPVTQNPLPKDEDKNDIIEEPQKEQNDSTSVIKESWMNRDYHQD